MTVTDDQQGKGFKEVPSHSGISCIGRIGGGKDDWYAQLDFNQHEAMVVRRGDHGITVGPIATVPLGDVWPEDDDYDPELMDDEQNRNLMQIVFSPEIVRACRRIRERALRMVEDYEKAHADDSFNLKKALAQAMYFIDEVAREVDEIDEALSVPEPCNPKHLAETE